MPIITAIGRKSWRLRALIFSIHAVLLVGAVTMVYPFMMMVSLSLCSKADYMENRVVPRWFSDEDALFRKYAATKYLEVEDFNKRHGTNYPDFTYEHVAGYSMAGVKWPYIIAAPYDLSDAEVRQRIDDYNEWKRGFIAANPTFTTCLFVTDRYLSSLNVTLDKYGQFLMGKYKSIEAINKAYTLEITDLRGLSPVSERPTFKTYLPARGAKFDDWAEFKRLLAAEDLEFIDIAEIENEWGRYLQSVYGTQQKANDALGLDMDAFYAVKLPFTCPPAGASEREKQWHDLWVDFAKNRAPLRFLHIENADAPYREFVAKKYGDVAELNALYETSYKSFDEIKFPSEISYEGVVTGDIYAFISSDYVSPEAMTIRSARWHWMDYLRAKYGSVEAASAAHSIHCASWDEVKMPRRVPLMLTPAERKAWRDFVVTACPVDYLVGNFQAGELRNFLDSRYGSAESLNKAWGTSYKSLKEVRLPKRGEVTPAQEATLREMLSGGFKSLFDLKLPAEAPDAAYREYLAGRYASIGDFNDAIRLYRGWDDVKQPIGEVEWAHFRAKESWFRKEFLVANYRQVADYMALHGRAFLNTIVLCTAMILAALTVNPMCAYALSRFQLGYANSILLFLLATMAFPGAVTQIPNFLLLKEAHLLNTYWALILPGLASGYSIFLLKGFFDSLPQELFEAGLIDGASEVQMFYRIALPLTTPVLAVIALGAFSVAYGEFMWAFIVCQNPKYWTVMVFLYDLQQDGYAPLVMASLVLASIPTLLVFLATQRVILRGIVVPQMK